MKEAEIRVTLPQAKKCLGPPETGRCKESFPASSERTQLCQHPDFRLVASLSRPVGGTSIPQPWEPNTRQNHPKHSGRKKNKKCTPTQSYIYMWGTEHGKVLSKDKMVIYGFKNKGKNN